MSVEVKLSGATLRYQTAKRDTFSKLALTLPAAKWTCILGASGCGKTSLLRLLAGLIPTKHHIEADIRCSDNLPIEQRIAYMAQQDLLLPWLSVIENVCLHSRLNNTTPETALAEELLVKLKLSGSADLPPDQLSGGMRQRVALARTLMQETPIVLMDEPFSALDAVTRYQLQETASQVLAGRTVLLITHDPQEALRLADQLYLFDGKGQLQALDLPQSPPPRKVDAQLGEFQQQLLAKLQLFQGENNHD